MAHESFEDDEVAEILNNSFVCIKVDREERPDIDSVYMNVAQRLNGNGGWPLTVFMTPEQKPFFIGTYFPKKSNFHMKGLMHVLTLIIDKWHNQRDEIDSTSSRITEIIKQQTTINKRNVKLSVDLIYKAHDMFKKSYDKKHGGFHDAPKFPMGSNLMFLMRYYELEKDDLTLCMIEKTLDNMYRGGIYDHIGYGFSRYSTDNKWLVPHFEKMLYDNAELIIVYTEAYLITKKDLYKKIAMEIIEYVLREMTDENGGFYSAQDADSEGKEGKYYIFTPDEIINVLGVADGEYFNGYFNISKEGNFEGYSIPNLIKNDSFNKNDPKIQKLISQIYDYRLSRTTLHKDDKILTSWNGIMITALAKAYRAFGDERYLNASENAIRFINKHLIDENDIIGVRYKSGDVLSNGTLDDYAFYIWALLEMYESTFEVHYLKRAVKFNEKMVEMFWDSENSGFYMTSKNSENLILRPKELYDGAIPSGNSVASLNIIKIFRLTGNIELEDIIMKQISFLADTAFEYPEGYSYALISLMYEIYSSKEIICIYKNKDDLKKFANVINKIFLVNTSIIAVDESELEQLSKTVSSMKNYRLKDDKTTFYICRNRECSLPFTNLNELSESL